MNKEKIQALTQKRGVIIEQKIFKKAVKRIKKGIKWAARRGKYECEVYTEGFTKMETIEKVIKIYSDLGFDISGKADLSYKNFKYETTWRIKWELKKEEE